DFEDGVIGSEWLISEWGGLNGTEVGGKLIMNGTYDPGETAPNTGGWNQYWMFYNASFTGFLDISVTSNITSYTGQEMAVGLAVIENTSVIWDNVTSWVQFNHTSGVSAVGEMHSWHNLSAVKTVFDSRTVTVGEAHTHRMVVHENKSIQLILDGATKGWWSISYPQYYPCIHIGLLASGASIEVEFDDFVLVTDANPTAVLTPTSTNLDVGELVGFDGSQSSYGVGSIEAYSFDFGDGNSSGWIDDSFTTHSYAAEGSYDARLKVRADNGKESEWVSVTICVDCAMPIAQYSVVLPAWVPLLTHHAIGFTANGSSDADGTVVGHLFDFGDGSTSGWVMFPYVSHSYDDDGTYATRAKVLDDDGHESAWSEIVNVTIENRSPHPLLWAGAHEVEVNESVYFDGLFSFDEDGCVTEYYIDLGDGTPAAWSTFQSVHHAFAEVGSYHVSLMVRDDDGRVSDVTGTTIVVTGKMVDQEAEDYSWWVVILLLLIILLLVIVVLFLQWRLVTQREGPEEPPPAEEPE
ncbi:MAG: PKD domain-containing protein, partial [Thermoplasmata archaeon]